MLIWLQIYLMSFSLMTLFAILSYCFWNISYLLLSTYEVSICMMFVGLNFWSFALNSIAKAWSFLNPCRLCPDVLCLACGGDTLFALLPFFFLVSIELMDLVPSSWSSISFAFLYIDLSTDSISRLRFVCWFKSKSLGLLWSYFLYHSLLVSFNCVFYWISCLTS